MRGAGLPKSAYCGTKLRPSLPNVAVRLVGVHIDISERKHHEQLLRASATHDALTGLPNRAALLTALQQAVVQWRADPARHFALMFLDSTASSR
jgi:hypothetical protein